MSHEHPPRRSCDQGSGSFVCFRVRVGPGEFGRGRAHEEQRLLAPVLLWAHIGIFC